MAKIMQAKLLHYMCICSVKNNCALTIFGGFHVINSSLHCKSHNHDKIRIVFLILQFPVDPKNRYSVLTDWN